MYSWVDAWAVREPCVVSLKVEFRSAMGADEPRFRVLHVSNISMTATREQIYQLFAFIGRIDEFKIYPSDNHPQLSTFTQKFAYVKFEDQKSVEVAQHLTNTVFIDRALVCIPSISDTIPDEDTALKTGGPAWPGQRQLPPNVVNQVQDLGDGQQMDNGEIAFCWMEFLAILPGVEFMELLTVDPTLAALGLPPYPALSANTEPSKVEEIRRTVYVGNIPKDCAGEEVMKFFNDSIGEVGQYLLLHDDLQLLI
uniref:RRM domain-containing protein n=1 Tax=Setaria digitata TaxID=48799 RepID=A0A915PW04_9BILA